MNLYPFEATAAKPDLTPEDLIENIDIGGPTMVRSAAKNFESVAVVTDPSDYDPVGAEIAASGEVSLATRLELARKAFALTARYDGKIATELERLAAASGSIELDRGLYCPSACILLSRGGKSCATEKIRISARLFTFRLGIPPKASRRPTASGQGALLQ